MKKLIYALLTVVVAAVSCACSGGSFNIEGHLKDAGTQNLRAVYLSGDTIISQWVPAVDGAFTLNGSTDGLAVVYLYNSQMKLITHIAVDGDNKIKIEGSIDDNYNITVTGSETNEEWNAFIRSHAKDFAAANNTVTDKAIADYVEQNPKSVVSTLLLTCDYADISSAKAQKLMQKIDKSAKPDALLSLYSQFFNGNDLETKKLNALKLRNEQDSIVLVPTYDKAVSVVYFWRANDSNRRATIEGLKEAYRDGDAHIVDVFIDHDTAFWRRTIREDSTKWTHYKAVSGPMDKTIADLNVKGSPFIIVADKSGTQTYRGASINDARKAISKILKK